MGNRRLEKRRFVPPNVRVFQWGPNIRDMTRRFHPPNLGSSRSPRRYPSCLLCLCCHEPITFNRPIISHVVRLTPQGTFSLSRKKIRLKAKSNSPRKIYRMLNMAQRPRCLSDSFAGKDVVDSSSIYRFRPDRSPPTKRVRRLLHDPTRVQPMERVFSEYDWRTDKLASTLGVVLDVPSSSPPRRSKSAFSYSRNTVEPPSLGDIIPVRNTISRVNPSALQCMPDVADSPTIC